MDLPVITIPQGVRLSDEASGDDVDLLPDVPVTEDVPPDGNDSVFDPRELFETMEAPLDLGAYSSQSGAVSGLGAHDRAKARELELRAMAVLLIHHDAVHYTQDLTARWSAIHERLAPWDAEGKPTGRFLTMGDCSSTGAWIDWLALGRHFRLPDVLNGQDWRRGNTATMLVHGKGVTDRRHWKVGDNLIYGPSRGATEHTAKYVGGGMVFSHGSEGGPYKLRWDYRDDLLAVRRPI